MRIKTEEEELEALKGKLKETNTQATDRIRNEMWAEKREEERRNAVMNSFFVITGKPMTEEQYKKYTSIFDDSKTPGGYNIKSFIVNEKIKPDSEVLEQSHEEFIKKQLIEVQADKILEEMQEAKHEKEKTKTTG